MKEFFSSQENDVVQKRQKLLLFLIIGIGIGLTLWLVFGGEKVTRKESPKTKAPIVTGGSRLDREAVWRYKMEDQQKEFQEQVKSLEGLLKDRSAQDVQKEEEFLKKIDLLEQKLEEQKIPEEPLREPILEEGIQKIILPLQKKESPKNTDNTIPCGSFAKAVLLSGVDASTAMNASADPRPLLLRIVDWGNLPGNIKSDLKDCRCTASTYGDISSERVHVRLEKLTCIKEGRIVETTVAGFVTGADGREGIRGKVVSKDAAYLGRGLLSGVLGGLSSIASPNKTPSMTVGVGSATIDPQSRSDLFSSSMASGSSQALDRLSHYYIDRAEQLQPVVQINPGQFVDIIFTEGVSLGSSSIKEEIAETRNKARVTDSEEILKQDQEERYPLESFWK